MLYHARAKTIFHIRIYRTLTLQEQRIEQSLLAEKSATIATKVVHAWLSQPQSAEVLAGATALLSSSKKLLPQRKETEQLLCTCSLEGDEFRELIKYTAKESKVVDRSIAWLPNGREVSFVRQGSLWKIQDH